MKCEHDFKYTGSFENEGTYIRYEECEYCGMEKTSIFESRKYWGEEYEVTNQ